MNDLERLKAAIRYIAHRSEDDDKCGAIKLNKILYFADCQSFIERGRSITGATYQHLDEGPAPRELLPARDELVREGAIEIEQRPYFNRVLHRIRLRDDPPDLSPLDSNDIRILAQAFAFLLPYDNTQASELSHKEWGWRLTHPGEDIPLITAWLSSAPLTQEQIDTGQKLWRERAGGPS